MPAINDLLTLCKQNWGRGTDNTIINANAILWYNKGQRAICKKRHWWFTWFQDTSIATVAGTGTYNLPTGFKDDDSMWISNSDGSVSEIVSMGENDFRRYYGTPTDSSQWAEPINYLLRATTVELRPIPDDVYNIIFCCWKWVPDLTENVDVSNSLLDNYEDLMEAETTMRGFQYLQQYDDAAQWETKRDKYYRDMVVDNNNRILPDEFGLPVRPGAKGTQVGYQSGGL